MQCFSIQTAMTLFYQNCFENYITVTMQNLAKTLRNRIFKIGMFGRVEKDSFSFTERKVVYSASLSDGNRGF